MGSFALLVKYSFYKCHDFAVLVLVLVPDANRKIFVPVAPPDNQNSSRPHKILLLERGVVKLCPCLYAQRVDSDSDTRLNTFL